MKCIVYLQEQEMLGRSPEDVAEFFHTEERLNKVPLYFWIKWIKRKKGYWRFSQCYLCFNIIFPFKFRWLLYDLLFYISYFIISPSLLNTHFKIKTAVLWMSIVFSLSKGGGLITVSDLGLLPILILELFNNLRLNLLTRV